MAFRSEQRSTGDRPSPEATLGWQVIRGYQPRWLRGDLAAGVTIGALLVTQCMAYAPLAGLPPNAAFHAVLVALPVYAALGTSRHLVVGPDPGTAAVAGTGLASVAAVSTTEYLEAAAALAILAGVALTIAGLLRLGFVAQLLSRPALIGYLTGLGMVLLVGQIPALTGVPFDSQHVLERIGDLGVSVDQLDGATTAMGAGTLALILVTKRIAPTWPAAVFGVVIATVAAAAFSLDEHGVALVGAINADVGFPAVPGIPIEDWGALVPTAVAVAVLGYADSFLTARGIAGKQQYALDPNQELTGLGAANLVAGGCQGMPVSSTGSGTAAAAAAGGITQATFLIAALLVLLVIVAIPGAIEAIPRAALAAVVVSAALSLLEIAGFRALWRESRTEFALACATFLAVLAFDVLAGILISIALGLLIALARISRPHDAVLADAKHLDGWVDTDAYSGTTSEPGLLVYRFDAPLFFANAERYAQRLQRALDEYEGTERWVVLDFEGVGSVDSTATETLATLCRSLTAQGVEVLAVARANTLALRHLARAGLVEPEGTIRVFPTINAAVRTFRTGQ
jgi:sulfate permease, SulP family